MKPEQEERACSSRAAARAVIDDLRFVMMGCSNQISNLSIDLTCREWQMALQRARVKKSEEWKYKSSHQPIRADALNRAPFFKERRLSLSFSFSRESEHYLRGRFFPSFQKSVVAGEVLIMKYTYLCNM